MKLFIIAGLFVLFQIPSYAQSPGGADQEFRELERKIQKGDYTDVDAQRFLARQLRNNNLQAVLSYAAKDKRLNLAAESLLVDSIKDEVKKEKPDWEQVTDLFDGYLTVLSGRLSTPGKQLSDPDLIGKAPDAIFFSGLGALPLLRALKEKNLARKMRDWGLWRTDAKLVVWGDNKIEFKVERGRITLSEEELMYFGIKTNKRQSDGRDRYTYSDDPEHQRPAEVITRTIESIILADENKRVEQNKARIASEKTREALRKAEKAGATTTSKSGEGTSPAELDAKNREHADKTGESAGETREKKNRGSKKPKSGEAK